MMTLDRMKELLEAYGANPRHWPIALRDEAEAFLRTSAQARALLEIEQTLDQTLDRWSAPAPNPWAAQRVVAAAHSLPQRRLSLAERFGWSLPGPFWPQVTGLAAALLVGVWIGFYDLESFDTSLAFDADFDAPDWETIL